VLEILKEEKTLTQIASAYGIHPSLLRDWKALTLTALPTTFEKRDTRAATDAAHAQEVQNLYAEIGRLTTQVNWLKKTPPVAYDIPAGEKRLRLPIVAHAPPTGYSIPKRRPTNVLVCGRPTSDQSP
jgi:putative transposase